MIESSPRIGISALIPLEPFGSAPIHMTIAQSPVAKDARLKIKKGILFEGKTAAARERTAAAV